MLPATAHAEVRHKRLAYKIKSTTMTGLLAWDDSLSGPRPAVLVLHDTMGLSVVPFEYTDTRERMCMAERRCLDLAALGHIAFAADLHADERPKNAMEAGRNLAGILAADPYVLEKSCDLDRARAGIKEFLAQPNLDSTRLACLGWGHGGLVALQLAARESRVRAVCTWYPCVQKLTPETAGGVKCPVLVQLGREDELVFSQHYRVWERQAREAGMRIETHYYQDAHHGFADLRRKMKPEREIELKPERKTAEEAWQDTLEFLEEMLGAPDV